MIPGYILADMQRESREEIERVVELQRPAWEWAFDLVRQMNELDHDSD